MIDNSRYRVFLFSSLGLAALSVGMFSYQHFFYEPGKIKDATTIYVTNTEIRAFEPIAANQFQAITIPSQGLVNGMIQDLSAIEGKYTLHGLQPGEVLVESQLTDQNLNEEGHLVIPLQASYFGDVRPNDVVSIYVFETVQDGEIIKHRVSKLFSAKKVHLNGRLSSVNQVIEGEVEQLYLKVTEKEMNAYYQAHKTGEIIVAKNMEELHTVVESLKGFELVEFNVEEPTDNTTIKEEPSVEEEDSAPERGTIRYTVGEDETWETLAIQFKTDVDTLYLLNPSVISIKSGIQIIVPSI